MFNVTFLAISLKKCSITTIKKIKPILEYTFFFVNISVTVKVTVLKLSQNTYLGIVQLLLYRHFFRTVHRVAARGHQIRPSQ